MLEVPRDEIPPTVSTPETPMAANIPLIAKETSPRCVMGCIVTTKTHQHSITKLSLKIIPPK